jgi:tetratricopeptide (TPR) repeat protein
MRRDRVLLLVVLIAACAACAPAPTGPASPELARIEGLGSLSFPNSGDAAAQEPFLRGVLLLHSFEFEPAAEAFRAAQAADPGFALAYWGEAMTFNHPLWQQQDRDAALEALGRLGATPVERAAKAPTERERLYVEALDALYGEGSKHDRDQAYMRAMARLQDRFPDDREARAFHALAILGSRDGVRDFATYMKAAAVAQPVFDANPDHPGAAHYLIHAFDDPVHAPLGLPAARTYSQIAPRAAHAQHMTSHIFVAMGLWEDVVAANIRARDTQDADFQARGERANVCGHYSSWLHYGHVMLGQTAEAATLLDLCHARMADAPRAGEASYFVSMRARQILDTGDWSLRERWTWDPPPGDEPGDAIRRFDYAWVNAFAALRAGDAAPARSLVAAPVTGASARIAVDELRGLLAIAAGRADEGIRILEAAAQAEDTLPFEFGPPSILKPTWELLGEELLTLGRAEEARAAFERALQRTPGRSLVVRGLEAMDR